jgi:hypothetical protein
VVAGDDKNILELQIAVHDALIVQKRDGVDELGQKLPH